MPVLANLDGEDHVEPTVEHTFLRFQAAKAREEAVRLADSGNFDAAAAGLNVVAAMLQECSTDPAAPGEIEDLRAEAERLSDRQYGPGDRKYHGARAMANRDLKAQYLEQVSRKRPQ